MKTENTSALGLVVIGIDSSLPFYRIYRNAILPLRPMVEEIENLHLERFRFNDEDTAFYMSKDSCHLLKEFACDYINRAAEDQISVP